MESKDSAIPDAAKRAVERGDVIAAIKITRAATGLGLSEAKEAVDAYSRRASAGGSTVSAGGGSDIPVDAVAFLNQGNMIDAIKCTRAKTGLGLKDSKEFVERYLKSHPDTNQRFEQAKRLAGSGMMRMIEFAALVCAAVLIYLWLTGKLS